MLPLISRFHFAFFISRTENRGCIYKKIKETLLGNLAEQRNISQLEHIAVLSHSFTIHTSLEHRVCIVPHRFPVLLDSAQLHQPSLIIHLVNVTPTSGLYLAQAYNSRLAKQNSSEFKITT
ncbi:hypothetical protein Nepgr_024813 [Nepenthes gracilis]|uniref:Uncharacterized protein n=1 Tax=Nepenthes gracilis TaxID=150966 RepID=A0AAD3T3X5_NEPGR|nr:hypothetical protein Nepgr_024813 [Nepenthes gracilis]